MSVCKYVVLAACIGALSTANAALLGPTSDITVDASVAAEGPDWRYTFNITNGEASNLWHFFVYTPFATFGANSTFPGGVASPGLSLDGVFSGYDARNIDASLTHVTNTWYSPFGGPNGVAPGASATLSFLASVLAAPDLLYAYELDGTYADGEVSGIGTADSEGGEVPEPSTWVMLGGGLTAVFFLKKRQ